MSIKLPDARYTPEVIAAIRDKVRECEMTPDDQLFARCRELMTMPPIRENPDPASIDYYAEVLAAAIRLKRHAETKH